MTAATPGRPSSRTVIRRLVRRLRRTPPRELLTISRALVVLVGVELGVRWVPLDRLGRLLGVRLDLQPSAPTAEPLELSELPASDRRALRATEKVTRHWPFCTGACLRRALVGGHLVRDLDPALRIGVLPDGGVIRAHAWLEIDRRPLEDIGGFTAFQQFPVAQPQPQPNGHEVGSR